MTRDEAKARVQALFQRVEERTTKTGRCYREWVEIWSRNDGAPPTAEDVQAFALLPRGQGHGVAIADGRIVLDCMLDSSD